MRKFLIWFFGLTIALILGAVGAYFLAKKYEEPVRNYIVGEVNKRLQSPVHVSDINFSLLENFPSASLVMDSVWAKENIVKMGAPDTLFFFEKVYLNLNLLDMLKGQYKINEIEARDGFVDLLVDDEGYDNYHIWVKNQDTTGFLLELDKVHIQRTRLTYVNHARQQEYRLRANDLYFNGRFSDESYTMAVVGNGYVNDILIKGTNYLHDREVDVETDLDIISKEERYGFRKGSLTIDDRLRFNISGELVGDGVDLHITGADLDVIRTLALIPSESREALDAYASSGVIAFDCTLKGAFGRTENPRCIASFSMEDASITRKGSDWKLSGLVGSGSIDNGEERTFRSVHLVLDDLKGELNGNPFQTAFSVTNFEKPNIDGSIKLSSDLAAMKEFFGIEWLAEGEGGFEIDAQISTTLENPSEPAARDFLNSKASGVIRITDAFWTLRDDQRRYSVEDAEFKILNNSLEIERYAGNINDCALVLKGRADGFLNYFFSESGVIDVKGKVTTGAIDLEELFPNTSESESGIVIAFPARAEWDLELTSTSFKQGKFIAEDISGRLVMNHFKVEATRLAFNSQHGTVSGKVGVYRFANNQFGLRTDFKTDQVNIKELFTTFNNFDQSFITAEVLEGKLNADITFQAFCDSLLNIDMQSIVSSLDITLSDGALVGFKPLMDVAEEIKKRPMLRLFIPVDELRKRLEDVRFATLTNEIGIRDGVVTIPTMEINSSALNLNVSGTHTFDDKIDYEMDFALSEVLQLKDRTEPYNEYVQRDESGKTRVFITMIGTTDDFEIDVKRTTLKHTLKEQVLSESKAVKDLLRDEFNAIAKDSVRKPVEKPKELEFEFDAESGTEADGKLEEITPATETPKEKSGDKKLLNKLIQKAETDKKKLKEGDFDDDDF